MRVYLRQTATRLLYAGSQRWTDQVREAIDFKDVGAAVEARRNQGLRDVEVVLTFDDGGAEPSLRLPSDQ